MIKLVTQFDNEKSRLSLATPTWGGCCCCCCCCIISTFAAASISARNFGNHDEKKLPDKPKKIKFARLIGFFLPLGLLVTLALSLLACSEIDLNGLYLAIPAGILYLFVMNKILKNKLDKLPGITSRVIISTILLFVLEGVGLFVGMYAILYLTAIYFPIAIILSIFMIYWTFSKKYDDLETKNKKKTTNK